MGPQSLRRTHRNLSHKIQVPLPHLNQTTQRFCCLALKRSPLTLHQSSDLHQVTAEVSKHFPSFPLDLRCL